MTSSTSRATPLEGEQLGANRDWLWTGRGQQSKCPNLCLPQCPGP